MSQTGSIMRGKKWAFLISLGGMMKADVEESMKKSSAMKKDYEMFLAQTKTPSKKKE